MDKLKYFGFLAHLNNTEKVDAFHAAPYLMEEFPELEEKEAKNIVLFWAEHKDEIEKGMHI